MSTTIPVTLAVSNTTHDHGNIPGDSEDDDRGRVRLSLLRFQGEGLSEIMAQSLPELCLAERPLTMNLLSVLHIQVTSYCVSMISLVLEVGTHGFPIKSNNLYGHFSALVVIKITLKTIQC